MRAFRSAGWSNSESEELEGEFDREEEGEAGSSERALAESSSRSSEVFFPVMTS